MSYRVSGLPVESFNHLFGLDDEALAKAGVRACIADAKPGFPCRVTLEDAALGERVLLMNFVHQQADTPFRASHAIYVRESATATATFVDAIPPAWRTRTLSVRAFDASGMLIDADLTEGPDLGPLAERLFQNAETAYLQVHYAKPGCYAGRVDRA